MLGAPQKARQAAEDSPQQPVFLFIFI